MEEHTEFQKGILNYKYLQIRTENLNFLVATEPCFQVHTHYFVDSVIITPHWNYV
jgi:hypothetical protein